jgi:hypothetical protein
MSAKDDKEPLVVVLGYGPPGPPPPKVDLLAGLGIYSEDPMTERFISANGDVYEVTNPEGVLRFVGHDPHFRTDEGDPPGAKRYEGVHWPKPEGGR